MGRDDWRKLLCPGGMIPDVLRAAFFSTYASPDPNALSPTFESKFARMEYIGDAKFALYLMRHTGEWVGIYGALSVDECMKAIQDDSWFIP